MAITYSPNLRLTLIGTGDQAGTWGNTTNTNIGTLIEQSIAGYVSQTVSDSAGSPTSLTISDGTSSVARNMVLVLQGALTGNRDVILPTNQKLYFITNNTTGGYTVTVKCAGQTGVALPPGAKAILVCNGVDIVEAANYFSGLVFPSSATIATLSGTTLGYASASLTTASIASGTVSNLIATNAGIGSASITTVTGTTIGAVASSTIRGVSGVITNFNASSATITTLTATSSTITTLKSTSATIDNLTVTSLNASITLPSSATIATLSGTTLGYGSASITTVTGTTIGTTAGSTIRGSSGAIGVLSSTTFSASSASITGLSATSAAIGKFAAGSSSVGNLFSSGNITANGNVTAYSDIRVKDNIQPIQHAVERILNINGVTYTRTDMEDKIRRYAGVIAQDVEEVFPEAVFSNGEVKTVDYNATIGLIIEAIKEQQADIERLKLSFPGGVA